MNPIKGTNLISFYQQNYIPFIIIISVHSVFISDEKGHTQKKYTNRITQDLVFFSKNLIFTKDYRPSFVSNSTKTIHVHVHGQGTYARNNRNVPWKGKRAKGTEFHTKVMARMQERESKFNLFHQWASQAQVIRVRENRIYTLCLLYLILCVVFIQFGIRVYISSFAPIYATLFQYFGLVWNTVCFQFIFYKCTLDTYIWTSSFANFLLCTFRPFSP